MVGLLCLVSQRAKLHVAGWTCAVFTRVFSGEVYDFYIVRPEKLKFYYDVSVFLVGLH
jgi:hypothetical protein